MSDAEHFDLVIVGTGSGNSIPGPEMDHWRIAVVERDVFGGTCLNRGCVPSKMLVHAAEVAHTVADAGRFGVRATLDGVDWPAVRDRVFGRIDPIAADGERYRRELPNQTVLRGEARFVDHRVLEVDGRRVTGDRIVLAAGARPLVPPVPGLAEAGYHTSDTIMRVDAVPERLVVLGGGYIGAELGHVFGSFGSRVTIVTRGPTMLSKEDRDVRDAVTAAYARRFDVLVDAVATRVERTPSGEVVVDVSAAGEHRRVVADELLLAAGRVPNSDRLHVRATGLELHGDGRVVVDDTLATNVEGIWAFGDLTTWHQLKHLANAEARVVAHNLLHPDDPWRVDYSQVPHAVFGLPRVGSVGLTEEQAAADGLPYVCAVTPYGSTAYGWALEDTDGFVKLVADGETRRLLGAHVVGPQAPTLVQHLVHALRFGPTVDEMAHDQLWIHPALSEVIENALLEL